MSNAQRDSMIADSANGFLTRIGGVGRARKLRDSGTAFDGKAWQEMAELGWFGLLLPEGAGGLELGGRELVDLMETMGAQLAPEPVAEVIAAGIAIAAADASSPLLGEIVAGQAVVVPVAGGNFQLAGGRLAGAAKPTAHLASATHALIDTRDSRQYIVPLSAEGVTRTTFAAVDGTSFSALRLDVSLAHAMELNSGGQQSAAPAPASVLRLAYAAYLAGLADAAFAMALDYLKTRKQFGVAIGNFQALQHRAATLYVRIASLKALLGEVAGTMGTGRLAAASAAAAFAATDASLQVTKECIQFHGAIGFADEHAIGLFLKRAMTVTAALGNSDECLDEYLRHSQDGADRAQTSSAA